MKETAEFHKKDEYIPAALGKPFQDCKLIVSDSPGFWL